MKIDSIRQSKQNFGLKVQTHRFINAKTASEANIFSDDALKSFLYYVQVPDFDETGLKILGKETCNNHFFYPEKNFHPRLSHLDFFGQHNAFARFMYHIINMFSSMKKSNPEMQIEHAARAKHFLDDMSVGLHVDRGTALKKYRDQKMHCEFEKYIYDNQDYFVNNYSKSDLPQNSRSFKELFMNTVNTSLKNEFPSANNKSSWQDIAQRTINLNIDSSKEFFNLIKHYNLPGSNSFNKSV